MRLIFFAGILLSSLALAADAEVFHGWSKDGSWLAYELKDRDDRVELYFCQTDPQVTPTWPAVLNGMEREEGPLSCVRFLDANKAPYQWKNQLSLPAPSMQFSGITLHAELVPDGETPGFTLEAGDKKQSCYASATRDTSKLQKSWFHPSGKFVGVMIDGNFRHCVITIKGAKAPVKGGGKKK